MEIVNIVKMSDLPKLNYKFTTIPITILTGVFKGTGQAQAKFHLKRKMQENNQEQFEKETK